EDRPILARRPPLYRKLAAWARRHKPFVAALVMLVLGVMILGGANLSWLWRQRAATEQSVHEDLRAAELLQTQGHWAEAAQALEVSSVEPGKAAERIYASAIHVPVVAALDDWAWIKAGLRDGGAEHLLDVVRRVDDDPWRAELRDPTIRRNRPVLERLAESA